MGACSPNRFNYSLTFAMNELKEKVDFFYKDPDGFIGGEYMGSWLFELKSINLYVSKDHMRIILLRRCFSIRSSKFKSFEFKNSHLLTKTLKQKPQTLQRLQIRVGQQNRWSWSRYRTVWWHNRVTDGRYRWYLHTANGLWGSRSEPCWLSYVAFHSSINYTISDDR